MLVSENNTSYGKDLGDIRLLETLLPELADGGRHRAGPGQLSAARRDAARAHRRADLDRRRSRPTSTCPSSTPRPACCARCGASATPTGSWSCWTRSGPRRRRPACGPTSSWASPARPRTTWRSWSVSSTGARLDAIGVFGYSDEDGTEAAAYENKLDADVVAERLARVSRLAEELVRAAGGGAVGETVRVLVESVESAEDGEGDGEGAGRPRRRTRRRRPTARCCSRDAARRGLTVGRMVEAKVVGTEGVDLVAEPLPRLARGVLRRRPDDGSPGIRGGRPRCPGHARCCRRLTPGTGASGAQGSKSSRGGKLGAVAVNQASLWNIANILTMVRLAAGAGLRGADARRRRIRPRLAGLGLGGLRRRHDHRPLRRGAGADATTSSPTSARSPTRSPTRRSWGRR